MTKKPVGRVTCEGRSLTVTRELEAQRDRLIAQINAESDLGRKCDLDLALAEVRARLNTRAR